MIRICTFLFYFLLVTCGSLSAQEEEDTIIVLKLLYNGKNLYVSNPSVQPGVFCTTQVRVNDSIVPCRLNASAYEIPLRDLPLTPGTVVIICLIHRADCTPKFLMPGIPTAYKGPASPNFSVKQISLPSANQIFFLTEGSPGNRAMIVQRRTADSTRWLSLDTLYSVAEKSPGAYTLTLSEKASPGDSFRIKILSNDQEKPVYSYRYLYQEPIVFRASESKRKRRNH